MNAALIAAILAFVSGLGFGYMWADCRPAGPADRRASLQYRRDVADLRERKGAHLSTDESEQPKLRLVIGSGGIR